MSELSFEQMLEESGCDAVAVVTPDYAHADLAVAAARHKKHLLIEKPLATDMQDVHRMMEAIRENGVRALCKRESWATYIRPICA